VQDADQPPVPELGEVEPDVLEQVVVDRQALPVGEEVLQEGLVGALPEGAGGVEAGEHRREGRRVGTRGEDAGIEAAEVGDALVDVRGGGKLGVVEQAVDVAQHEGVGVEEDDALVGELPEAELDEVVEGRVEGGLLALGEGRARVLLSAGVGDVEGVGGREQVAGGEAGAPGREGGEGGGGDASGVEDNDVGLGAGAEEGVHERDGADEVVGVCNQGDVGAPVAGGAVQGRRVRHAQSGQRTERGKAMASKSGTQTSSSSFSAAIRVQAPCLKAKASSVRAIGSTNQRCATPAPP